VNQFPHLERLDDPGPLRAPRVVIVGAALMALGVLGFVLALAFWNPTRAWGAVLQGMMIPTWISAGAMFFIAIHSICGAHWTVPIRRVMEGLSGGFVITAIAFILLACFGMSSLYEWASGDGRQALFHAHTTGKGHWMDVPRVLVTTLGALISWLYLRDGMVRLSLRQDQRLDTNARHSRLSVIFLLVFAVTFTLFAWDTLLSLQARFISTTWGFYCFVGAVQTFLAVLSIVCAWLSRGPLKQVVRPHIVKDLGTWMVAWSCIWAYIAYTQYVIIYFANLNEEAYWYLQRTQHGYGPCYVLEVLLRFPLPFLALMSQRVRSDIRVLAAVSALVLLGCWIDLWWIVMPALSPNAFHGFWAIPELLVGAGFVGAFLVLAVRFWSRNGLLPHGDPRLLSAINAEHLH
jgi:hypothetical protein